MPRRGRRKVAAIGNIGSMPQIGLYSGAPAAPLVKLLDWATSGPHLTAFPADID